MARIINKDRSPMIELQTKTEVLNRVHNENLADLIQAEINVKMLGRLALSEPSNQTVIAKKREMENIAKVKADALKIIEEMLAEEAKKDMKNPEEPKAQQEKKNV